MATIETIIEYLKENEEEFNELIEDLDSWNGYLGDDRYYPMDELNDFYSGTEPIELLYRVFYGHDEETWTTDEHGEKHYGEFNPNRDYFRYNGYGNLVSADYKDYSGMLDHWFVEKVIENRNNLYLSDEMERLIDEYENGQNEETEEE